MDGLIFKPRQMKTATIIILILTCGALAGALDGSIANQYHSERIAGKYKDAYDSLLRLNDDFSNDIRKHFGIDTNKRTQYVQIILPKLRPKRKVSTSAKNSNN